MAEAERALAALLAVAREHGLPTEDARIVRDLTNLLVHLAPAPVVGRVQLTLSRLRDDAAAATEIAAGTFLAGRGAPVVPPAGEVDPGPHRRDGFLVTFWRWVDHDPAREDPVAAGRALRHLHDAFADFEGELPTCDRLGEIRRLLASFPPSPELTELVSFAERLRPLDGRPIHGDSHLRNVLWSPAGPLWGDLENVCRGPVEYDLANLRFRQSAAGDAAIAAYGPHGDTDAMLPYVTLFLAAWTLVVAERAATEDALADARRRVERALAYAREM
jgi:Ser/Thr protein kinase RdoA (MazF antagonist)